MGWLIGDQWVKRKFTPVGFKIYSMLTEKVGFVPIDLIAVARRGQSSNTRVWHYRAQKFNFFLRGFKYLILAKKPDGKQSEIRRDTKIKWQRYK